MSIDIILAIIIVLALIGTFVYLHLKKRKNKTAPFIIDEKDIIDYTPISSVLSIFEMLLLDEINGHRFKMGLNKLLPEKECRALAYQHTKYMINQKNISHDNAYERRYELFRRGFTKYGENVGYGFSTAVGFFKGYMNSQSHRDAFEDPDFTHVGVRGLKNDKGKYYNALIFGRYEKI
jgi:uncharacterized protein YkwD